MARRWWIGRYGRAASGPEFDAVVPEELVGEMITDLWEKRDRAEALLQDANWNGDRMSVSRELASLEEALGIRTSGVPIATGDALTDYLLARQLAGTITPEDLEMTGAEFDEMQGG